MSGLSKKSTIALLAEFLEDAEERKLPTQEERQAQWDELFRDPIKRRAEALSIRQRQAEKPGRDSGSYYVRPGTVTSRTGIKTQKDRLCYLATQGAVLSDSEDMSANTAVSVGPWGDSSITDLAGDGGLTEAGRRAVGA